MRQSNTLYQFDWLSVVIYFALVILGFINIYAATYDEEVSNSLFSITQNSGKQLIWIGVCTLIIIGILIVDFRFYDSVAAYFGYGLFIFLLLAVLVFGRVVGGAQSWFELGPFRFQPSEFAKFATLLALSKYLGSSLRDLSKLKHQIISVAIIATPAALILLQPDAGSAMVFLALLFTLYREGFTPIPFYLGFAAIFLLVVTLLGYKLAVIIATIVIGLLLIGLYIKSIKKMVLILICAVSSIAYVLSIDFIIEEALQPHQQKRVRAIFDPNFDPKGINYNVIQSKIAIGSGGFSGKGFLNGTQTKFNFVPEQTTDFIFCTIGEEYGWVGSMVIVILFSTLFIRLINLAERQKSKFARIYGYGVSLILFFHFTVNIAMTIGLFPVIGIPLPFISYGGSSLIAFTILLFIFLKLDAHRMQLFER